MRPEGRPENQYVQHEFIKSSTADDCSQEKVVKWQ